MALFQLPGDLLLMTRTYMGCIPVSLHRRCRLRTRLQRFGHGHEIRAPHQIHPPLLLLNLVTASPPHLQGLCELTRINFVGRPTITCQATLFLIALQANALEPTSYPNPCQRTKSRRGELERPTTPRPENSQWAASSVLRPPL